ncbi:hypothetical protein FWG76_00740 [Candidatus Saccharibacteria bacterium]|nr:hypothetical protein [Candidatus Saccharibacteria bacterium]
MAETISRNSWNGSWDMSEARSVEPDTLTQGPWSRLGGASRAEANSRSGVFGFNRWPGNARNDSSHRTILLGY